MSQTELVAALGITFQQVQKYEKGSNRISAGRLFEIAHLLEVPITFFFEGAPQPQTGPLHGAREGNPRRRLMSAFPGKRPNLVARQNDAVEPIPPLASTIRRRSKSSRTTSDSEPPAGCAMIASLDPE